MLKYIITAGVLLFAFSFQLKGQVTDATNVPNVNHWVGYNANSGIELPILNIGDPRINISSKTRTKMYINELNTWTGLNGITRDSVQRTLMGLRGQQDDAWSILHLLDDSAGPMGTNMYRDWLNVGVSYTSNIDFMYTGLLERPVSGSTTGEQLQTDAVIAWGCQDGPNPDNFRILFLAPDFGIQNASTSEQGLETFRITPQGNVGIGDFSSPPFGLNEQPTQRLDVDGTGQPSGLYHDALYVDGELLVKKAIKLAD